MRLKIDEDKCIGCGLCEETFPDLIEMGKFTAKVKVKDVPDELETEIRDLSSECPSGALAVVQENEEYE